MGGSKVTSDVHKQHPFAAAKTQTKKDGHHTLPGRVFDHPSKGEKTMTIGAEDRVAIADLIYAYAWHFDRNEPEDLAALFTTDAVIDYGPNFTTIVGREAIVPAIEPGLRTLFSATSHNISNVRLHADGDDAAAGTSYVYAWHAYHSGAPDGHMWGQYAYRFRRTEEGWRIAELVLKVMGLQDFHRADMHPVERRP